MAKQTIANANASPGSLGSGSEMTISYDNMSSEEFNKIVQGVIDGDIKYQIDRAEKIKFGEEVLYVWAVVRTVVEITE